MPALLSGIRAADCGFALWLWIVGADSGWGCGLSLWIVFPDLRRRIAAADVAYGLHVQIAFSYGSWVGTAAVDCICGLPLWIAIADCGHGLRPQITAAAGRCGLQLWMPWGVAWSRTL